uniref:Glutaredoxin domain-containing protein n=1 Tax=Araucaria cunninghamii TaxID=56994 RepID=A0A0D6QZ80_ARACU
MMQGLQYKAGSGGVGGAACKRPTALQLQAEPDRRETMENPVERVQRLASENAVLVFSMTSCCMCHVVKRLFCSLGVNPAVCELDEEEGGLDMEKVLARLVGKKTAVPAVFIGGNLVGGLDRVMAAHISGELVPKLKEAGALWL